MDRRRKMLKKRRKKQAQVEEVNPNHHLIFKEGTAGVIGRWQPGNDQPKPASPNDQP